MVTIQERLSAGPAQFVMVGECRSPSAAGVPRGEQPAWLDHHLTVSGLSGWVADSAVITGGRRHARQAGAAGGAAPKGCHRPILDAGLDLGDTGQRDRGRGEP